MTLSISAQMQRVPGLDLFCFSLTHKLTRVIPTVSLLYTVQLSHHSQLPCPLDTQWVPSNCQDTNMTRNRPKFVGGHRGSSTASRLPVPAHTRPVLQQQARTALMRWGCCAAAPLPRHSAERPSLRKLDALGLAQIQVPRRQTRSHRVQYGRL